MESRLSGLNSVATISRLRKMGLEVPEKVDLAALGNMLNPMHP